MGLAVFFLLASLFPLSYSYSDKDFLFTRVDRIIDLQSQAVRIIYNIKFEHVGEHPSDEIAFALPKAQGDRLSFVQVATGEGKQKNLKPIYLRLAPTEPPSDFPFSHNVSLYSIKLHRPFKRGERAALEAYVVVTGILEPFPSEILQSESQFVILNDNHFVVSPYAVKSQTLVVRLPSANVEEYTQLSPSRHSGQEIKFGPYEARGAFSFSPLRLHAEHNRPFPVVRSLVREIQVSHWGNIYVTETYDLLHAGAKLKGSFSRLDFQTNPMGSGVSALRQLIARLPPRAHSILYRDEIGNISTSHVRGDARKTEMEFETRYPLMGGWSAIFTIGYSLPLQDFIYLSKDGKRFLNITFGCPLSDVVVNDLTIKVALPEGSTKIYHTAPFHLSESREVKFSYLDTVGRPVIVLNKKNVVNEHSALYFQVYYSFSGISLLVEPLLLVFAFFGFFLACMAYIRFDFPISKTTSAYIARLQQEEVLDAIQKAKASVIARGRLFDKLDNSLHALGRSGDVATTKSVRKSVEASLKDTLNEIKSSLESLEKLPRQPAAITKIFLLMTKDKERQEKTLQKHMLVVDAYEHKTSPKDIDSKVNPIQQKIVSLNSEIKELLLALDE